MSVTLTFKGNTSILTADYFPPLELSDGYVCGLVELVAYNSIPNIDINNNLCQIGDTLIEIPIGSYEIDDIASYLQNEIDELYNGEEDFQLLANNNTMKCEIMCTKDIHFDTSNSVGELLGFSKKKLIADQWHISDKPVNITNINTIHVQCNIIQGSYMNNKQVHTLHEFCPEVSPGYKINEVPRKVIYLPVNTKRISSITLKLVDQDNNLINFRGEPITIRLHLKP